ncbi:MAG: GIY-YIG nuclease family protein [Candidatus Paceibacterota bacterium]
MFYVYVISTDTNEIYKGYTSDLKKRLEEHNQGKNFSTKGNKWKCIYYEACIEEADARRREKYLKTTQGNRLLKRRLKEYFYKQRAS